MQVKKKKKQEAIDKFYEYLLNRDYRATVSSDSYSGIWDEINKYQNKKDTLYIYNMGIVQCGNSYSASFMVRRKCESKNE